MTYQEMNRRLRAAIADEREAQAVGRMIIETAFGLSWADALCGGLKALSAADAERLETVVSRIEQGEPVQYAIGLAPFCGRLFEVTPAVLIPRPETEGLVAPLPSPLPSSILDIGTGSGCIAITLALMHPEAHVDAIDISEEALRVARRNAERLGANVNFWQMDILSEASLPFPQGGEGATLPCSCACPMEASPLGGDGRGAFSLIVSNPPYIAEKERSDMEAHVLEHEPHQALFVPDSDPLLFYHAIAEKGLSWLKPGGQLLFEINPIYARELEELLAQMGFVDIEVFRDQFGRERFVRAYSSYSSSSSQT